MPLIIYPRGWLHNMNVYGFLKVIKANEQGIGFALEDILMSDGSVQIDDKNLQKLYEPIPLDSKDYPKIFVPKIFALLLEETKKLEKVQDTYEVCKRYFNGKSSYYENYVNKYLKKDQKDDFLSELSEQVKSIFVPPSAHNNSIDDSDRCFLCGRPVLRRNGPSKLRTFSMVLFKEFSSSDASFPNAFWNMENTYWLCDVCSQMAHFRHLVFPREGRCVFVNAASFKAIWQLNEAYKAYEKDFEQRISYELTLSRIVSDFVLKSQRLLGVWEKQNIEVISLEKEPKKNKIELKLKTYHLPSKVIDLLLNVHVSSILNELRNDKIFEVIVQERFSELLTLLYLMLRHQLTKRILNIHSSDTTKEFSWGEAVLKDQWKIDPSEENIYEHIKLITQLFSEIRRVLEVSREMPRSVSNLDEFREIGKEDEELRKETACTPNLNELRKIGKEDAELFKRTAYRLLELVRLGKKEEVYHLLLRAYMAGQKAFPEKLNSVFTYDIENFKNAMYAFIGGITAGGEGHE